MFRAQLLQKIQDRTALIVIIGQGYVGLPLAVALAEEGFHVIGYDVSEAKVRSINAAHSYISDVPSENLAPLIASGHLRATTDPAELRNADIVSICVPTPLTEHKDPDLSYVIAASDAVARAAHAGMLVVLESTTYPGTTDEVLVPRLQATGLAIGEELFIAFSPERIDPANKAFTVRNTPKVVGGVTDACQQLTSAYYATIVNQIVPVSNPVTAEMVKLLENTFRAVNIGFANEMAMICRMLGIDVWEVIRAASTKPFGFMPFYPGPGLGGHCIPLDPLYLSWKMRGLSYNPRFIDLADSINTAMPAHVVSLIMEALNDEGKALCGSRIAVLGAAYKKDVDDMRESPALRVIELLHKRKALVEYHDPHVTSFHTEAGVQLHSADLSAAWLRGADCVVITTDHTAFDHAFIAQHSRLIVDSRNMLRDIAPGPDVARIVRL